MADEVIRIDTRIDIDDAERDLDSLKKKLQETAKEGKEGFKKASQSIDTADKTIFKVFYLKDIDGWMTNLGHVKGLEQRDEFTKPIHFKF